MGYLIKGEFMHKFKLSELKHQLLPGKSLAYTMSEVLITLAIIGVIISLLLGGFTISEKAKYPTMRAVFKNELATALATMNTEQNLSKIQNQQDFIDQLNGYYDTSNTCDSKACFAAKYKDMGGNEVNLPLGKDYYTFTTKSGASVSIKFVPHVGSDLSTFIPNTNNIDLSKNSYEVSNAALNYVTGVFDVNGAKGPNKIGEDVGIIMPAYSLDKDSGEYLTFDSEGNVIVENKNKNNSEDSDSNDKIIVNKDGNFVAKDNESEKVAKCGANHENFVLDDYGNCTICGLSNATCAAQGKQLNKKSCLCEYNISCPKNKILDKDGNCVCKPITAAAGPYALKDDKGNPIQDSESCTYRCSLGASLKCLANGGTWNSTTCSCNCGSSGDSLSAAGRCAKKVSYNGYAQANPNNYCTCECLPQASVEKLIQQKENPENKADFQYNTLYDSDINNKCYKCAEPVDETLSLKRNDDEKAEQINGLCTVGCSQDKINEFNNFTEENKSFYEPPKGYDGQNLSNTPTACSAKCVLTQATCDALANQITSGGVQNKECKYLGNIFHTCAYTSNPVNPKFPATEERPANSSIGENSALYTCNISQLYNNNGATKIKLKANKETCRCELDLDAYKNSSVGAGIIPDGKLLVYHYHGKCGHEAAYQCKYTYDNSSSNVILQPNPNANNPYDNSPTYGLAINEKCLSWWDPILLIKPYSCNTVVSNQPNMKNGTVSVKLDQNSANSNITWIAEQAKGTASYYFLIKNHATSAIPSIKEHLFTDMAHNTGLQELNEVYDTNKDGVVNELDNNFYNLGLWADTNANGIYDAGDIKLSVEDANVIDIYTQETFKSDQSGIAEQTDKAITSIHGKYMAGIKNAVNLNDGNYWVKRVANKAKNQIEWYYVTKEKKTIKVPVKKQPSENTSDASNTSTTASSGTSTPKFEEKVVEEDVTYKYLYNNGKYELLDNNGNKVQSDISHPLRNVNASAIKQYYEKDGSKYKVQEYESIDILFKENK